MQKLTWLENLKKAEIPPTPAPVSAKVDQFADLFRTDVVATPAENTPSVVDTLLKAEENRKFHIREERRTRDPRVVTTENSNGVIAEFDEDNRIIRTYIQKRESRQSLFEVDRPDTVGFVSEGVAKILGLADLQEEFHGSR